MLNFVLVGVTLKEGAGQGKNDFTELPYDPAGLFTAQTMCRCPDVFFSES